MNNSLAPTKLIGNQDSPPIEIPLVGFGTYPMHGLEGSQSVTSAINLGYRLIDTAMNYDNEGAVGEGIRCSGIDREELVVTSKLPGRFHERPQADFALRESLWRLGLDYLDVYLIHWPNPSQGKFIEAWQALIEAQAEGLVKVIGTSNFTVAHLETLRQETGVLPAINQIEIHPYFPQVEQLKAHQRLGVATEAWSPLGKASAPYQEKVITEAAKAHGVTPAQVTLRWHVQRDVIPIPKSANPTRQEENLDIFGFELSEAEMAAITALGRPDGRLFGGDPNTHEEM